MLAIEQRRTIRTGHLSSRARDITSATAPSDPARSPMLRILRAWIEAEMSHPGDQARILDAVEGAVRQVSEGSARRALGDNYQRVPPDVRELLGRRDGEGLKRLLGDWPGGTRESAFQPGRAGLTPREAEAYWLRIRGWSALAIARELTPSRQRFDRRLWVSVQTVYNLTHQAQTKVLIVFGLRSGQTGDLGPY